MAVFTPGDHGSTFGGNPLAAAVGEAALALLEQGAAERARVLGARLLAELRALDHPAIVEVRGKGLLVGVEIDPRSPARATSAMRCSTRASCRRTRTARSCVSRRR